MDDEKSPDKKERLLTALEKGMVMVHLDARRPGVLVPENLRDEVHLRLNLSYRFEPPDLSVGEWGVKSTLSFGGKRFRVSIPWSALFAITSHVTREFWMYPDDMPPEVLKQASESASASQRTPEPEGELTPTVPARPRAMLREVSCELKDDAPVPAPAPAPAEQTSEPADPPETPKPRRGHLRVVK
jgi:stringent starvation protein B